MALNFDYQMNYLATIALCVVIMQVMAGKMNSNVGSIEEINVFRKLEGSAVTVMAMQAIWMLGTMNSTKFPRWINWIVNGGDLLATALVIYFWFRLVFIKVMRALGIKSRRMRYIIHLIPLVVQISLIVTSVWSHGVFFINAANDYERGCLYGIHVAICFLYYVMSVAFLIRMRIASNRRKKEVHRLLFLTICPVIGGMLQVFVSSAPFTIITFTASTLFFFINMQEERITTDALTGLSNRSRLSEVLAAKIRNADDQPFVLFLADIDHFKRINDTFGHLAGDIALVKVADAFKNVATRYGSITIFRYGGDEFVMTIDQRENVDPEAFIKEVQDEITKQVEKAQIEFKVTLTMGYCEANDNTAGIDDVISEADKWLYAKKKGLSNT